jgi:REP element-mobilizing transposase RayT
MKDKMYQVVAQAREKYLFKLISCTVMNNHFHIIIRTVEGGAPISNIMQYIKGRYGQWYNRTMKRCGPFWDEKYKDIIAEEHGIQSDAYNKMNLYVAGKRMVSDRVAEGD